LLWAGGQAVDPFGGGGEYDAVTAVVDRLCEPIAILSDVRSR
jgi:hypothetical protein